MGQGRSCFQLPQDPSPTAPSSEVCAPPPLGKLLLQVLSAGTCARLFAALVPPQVHSVDVTGVADPAGTQTTSFHSRMPCVLAVTQTCI